VIVKKTENAQRIMQKEYEKVSTRCWQLKEGRNALKNLKWLAQRERGRRKGETCPAKKLWKKGQWHEYTSCEARKHSPTAYNEGELYRKFCCTCRLTHEEARIKTVMERITHGKGDI